MTEMEREAEAGSGRQSKAAGADGEMEASEDAE